MLMQIDNLSKLPAISLRLLPLLASKTDIDGRINITVNEIENAGIMSKKVVKDALYNLEKENWIYREEDYYYSNFNVNSEESRKDYHYINLYKFFSNKTFFGLHKRQLIFLYYILSAKMPGTEHSIALEHLYNNRTNQRNVKLPLFISYKDMLKNLVILIENGFFEVRLGNSKLYLDNKTKDIKEKINVYAGKNEDKRKQRMSLKEENNKIIHIRISKDLVSKDQVMDIFDSTRLSTLLDLKSIAMDYGCSIDIYGEDVLKKIHATKDALYKELKIDGIRVYREALIDFFENRSYSFENLMKNKELPNVLKNYYVIPRIEKKINSIFKEVQSRCVGSQNGKFDSEQAIRILQQSNCYLSYFINYAYLDRIILLDDELKCIDYNWYDEISKANRSWYLFRIQVEKIYNYEKEAYGNDSERVLYLAKQGLLSNKSRQSEDISIQKQRYVDQKPEEDILFYNWLEE